MKVQIEVDVPELDMIKLREPVKEAMEKALKENTEKILQDRASFFLISDEDLKKMYVDLLGSELKKKAIIEVEKFKPVISISSTT